MLLPPNKKIYFLSDFHLGAPDHASSLQREKIVVDFLDSIKKETPNHSCFVKEAAGTEGWYNYHFHLPTDETRNINLAILVFHFP